MAVHRELGPGFLESVYKNSLVLELREAGLEVEIEKRISVFYMGVVVGEFLVDLFVGGHLVIELKANASIGKMDEIQVVNYLNATRQKFGLSLNFGASSLEFKRKYSKGNNPENPVNPV